MYVPPARSVVLHKGRSADEQEAESGHDAASWSADTCGFSGHSAVSAEEQMKDTLLLVQQQQQRRRRR